ncbi:hypothetical protein [Flavobacterium coralii]|uniref:hypothetical protein n=1 Tax=Flavobacterium coralii TaxID=2838017 RepID=UPI000C5C806D|nr:hypothetical protein [Flavobacterium sp.]|tara:strand:- start:7781 stop:8281 length:501 start_codon:yes stop_codon:yes gene_type:complete
MIDFTKIDANTLATGVDDKGVKYLEIFLKEYTRLFGGSVNPGCNKCLTSYLDKYKKAMAKGENKSGYKLKAKYNGIPLGFGKRVLVTNENITEEYAEQLLQRPNGKDLFEVIPDKKQKEPLATEVVALIEAATTLEEIEKFADDTRKTVIAAYNAKKEALEEPKND